MYFFTLFHPDNQNTSRWKAMRVEKTAKERQKKIEYRQVSAQVWCTDKAFAWRQMSYENYDIKY